MPQDLYYPPVGTRVAVVRPPPPPIEDAESQWPPDESGLQSRGMDTGLSYIPPHVRRAMMRAGVSVSIPTQYELDMVTRGNARKLGETGSAAGFYGPWSRGIRIKKDMTHGSVVLFPGTTPTGYMSPATTVPRHEMGHAVDAEMVRTKPWLASGSSRFRNICIKYNSGVPGSGGGFGEHVDPYSKHCDELYATLVGIYYSDPDRLKRTDPQAFQFMEEVDRGLRMLGAPKGAPIVPPMTPPGSM